MSCTDIEILLCDYLDGTLGPGEKAEVAGHLETCSACAELARDAGAAMTFMNRAAEVEAPAGLVNRILFARPAHLSKTAGVRGWVQGLLGPILQPKFAMGMAMTILSLAMLAKFVAPVRQLRPADLSPTRVWATVEDKTYRSWERTVKFYESIRLVYQVQTRLREWNDQQDAEQQAPVKRAVDERRVDVQQKKQ